MPRKEYPDLKFKLIRGLKKLECHQRKFNYLKSAAECTSRAIVSLDICTTQIKSVKQARQLQGIGENIGEQLKVIMTKDDIDTNKPKDGFYASSASALLVTMYKLTQAQMEIDFLSDKKEFINHDTLREESSKICEEDLQEEYSDYGSKLPSPQWLRINILKARNYIKQRTRLKEPVYELLPLGKAIAETILGITSTTDLANDRYLYTNDDKLDGVILQIDNREIGEDGNNLIMLCGMFKRHGIRYRTEVLNCGDYGWKYRCNGKETVLPFIVERKRADDFAESVRDGRYKRQKEKLKSWRERFDGAVELKYLIEGCLETYVVECAHECVARCGNPTLIQLTEILSELERDVDFDVSYTSDVETTVGYIVQLTANLTQRIEAREFRWLNVNNVETSTNMPAGSSKMSADRPSNSRSESSVIEEIEQVNDRKKNKTIQTLKAENLVIADTKFNQLVKPTSSKVKTKKKPEPPLNYEKLSKRKKPNNLNFDFDSLFSPMDDSTDWPKTSEIKKPIKKRTKTKPIYEMESAETQLLYQDPFGNSPVDDLKADDSPVEDFKRNDSPFDCFKDDGSPFEYSKGNVSSVLNYKRNDSPVLNYERNDSPFEGFRDNDSPVLNYEGNDSSVLNYERNDSPFENFKGNESPIDLFERNDSPLEDLEGNSHSPFEDFKDGNSPGMVCSTSFSRPQGLNKFDRNNNNQLGNNRSITQTTIDIDSEDSFELIAKNEVPSSTRNTEAPENDFKEDDLIQINDITGKSGVMSIIDDENDDPPGLTHNNQYKIDTLKSIFPDVENEIIKNVLFLNGWSLERTVEELLA